MKKAFFFVFIFLSGFLLKAENGRVTEIPFIMMPTGQMIVKVTFSPPIGEQYMLFETTGVNAIRKDQKERIDNLGIDTTSSSVKIPTTTIGDFEFGVTKFRLKKYLASRGDIAFPLPVLGTLGPSFFKKKVVQIDYKNSKFRIADKVEDLKVPDAIPSIIFRSSFRNPSPTLEVHTLEFGNQMLYVNTGLPVGFCFDWASVVSSRRKRFIDHMEKYRLNLFGKDGVPVLGYKVGNIFVETEWEIRGHEIAFSERLYPSIGNEFLKHFVVTFDFPKSKLYLEPNGPEEAKYFNVY